MSNDKVTVCRGGDCRKRSETKDLIRHLANIADVETSGCLGICRGPVVVLNSSTKTSKKAGNKPAVKATVIARVRTPKERRDLEAMVRDGAGTSDRLKKRVVQGGKRSKALKRAGVSG